MARGVGRRLRNCSPFFSRQGCNRNLPRKQRCRFYLWCSRFIGAPPALDLLFGSNPLFWCRIHTSLCKPIWFEDYSGSETRQCTQSFSRDCNFNQRMAIRTTKQSNWAHPLRDCDYILFDRNFYCHFWAQEKVMAFEQRNDPSVKAGHCPLCTLMGSLGTWR